MINRLYTGAKASVQKCFTIQEVMYYCKIISGDSNPLHFDAAFASESGFGKCIVPGIMTTSLFGGLLGSELPGKGTIHLGQTSKFLLPVFVDETITALIELIDIRTDKPIYTFRTEIINSLRKIVLQGEAVVKYAPSC